jgi:hypothetical protein
VTPSRSKVVSPASEAVSSAACSAGVAANPGNASTIRPRACAEMLIPGSITISCRMPTRSIWAARRARAASCCGPAAVTVTRSGAPRSAACWAAAARFRPRSRRSGAASSRAFAAMTSRVAATAAGSAPHSAKIAAGASRSLARSFQRGAIPSSSPRPSRAAGTAAPPRSAGTRRSPATSSPAGAR